MENTLIILASGSPRRRELLERLPFAFLVDAAEVDEHCAGDPETLVRTVSLRKAQAVQQRRQTGLILSADTVVVRDGILGKPRDREDAARMLRILSGSWHEVYTGVTLLRGDRQWAETAVTRVHFMQLAEVEIRRYVDSGEPMDKAGAYGIQGPAGAFIDRIEGCYHNVMGLPLAVTYRMILKAIGEDE